jgi:hypothetical protein
MTKYDPPQGTMPPSPTTPSPMVTPLQASAPDAGAFLTALQSIAGSLSASAPKPPHHPFADAAGVEYRQITNALRTFNEKIRDE